MTEIKTKHRPPETVEQLKKRLKWIDTKIKIAGILSMMSMGVFLAEYFVHGATAMCIIFLLLHIAFDVSWTYGMINLAEERLNSRLSLMEEELHIILHAATGAGKVSEIHMN